MNPRRMGYPYGEFSSGIFQGLTSGLKFIPYNPAKKESGINMVEIIVSVFITSFILKLI
jgi:hypothetical protein